MQLGEGKHIQLVIRLQKTANDEFCVDKCSRVKTEQQRFLELNNEYRNKIYQFSNFVLMRYTRARTTLIGKAPVQTRRPIPGKRA